MTVQAGQQLWLYHVASTKQPELSNFPYQSGYETLLKRIALQTGYVVNMNQVGGLLGEVAEAMVQNVMQRSPASLSSNKLRFILALDLEMEQLVRRSECVKVFLEQAQLLHPDFINDFQAQHPGWLALLSNGRDQWGCYVNRSVSRIQPIAIKLIEPIILENP